MDNISILAKNLTKKFGNYTAVDKINLSIKKGEIYGFLGPNGAGKTTTIRMLTGTLTPTAGEISILGLPMTEYELEIKRRIGVVPDEPKIYEGLRGREFLDFIIGVYNLDKDTILPRVEELTSAFVVDYLEDYIGDYSHGMSQKLMLISVLMREPEVMFLDEPTVGLDARAARILKELLNKYAKEGATIFLTTHVLEIAEKMCNRIGIIDKGLLIAEGSLEELQHLSNEGHTSLEDLFLELTGNENVREIVEALK
ncbi:MAG TPA: ABC transporter ATP-binding protein [Clostridiales bacterium]|nr:ABC transporter ATP-binding protein [Clostridiales bacterium]